MNTIGKPKNDDISVFPPTLSTSFDELFVNVNAFDQPKIADASVFPSKTFDELFVNK